MDLSARSDKSQCPPPPWTHLCPLYKGTLGGEGGWSEVCQAFVQQYLSCHQLCWLVSFPKGIPSGDSSWFLQTSAGLWSGYGVSNIPCSSLNILYQLKTFKMHFVSCCVMSPLDVPLPHRAQTAKVPSQQRRLFTSLFHVIVGNSIAEIFITKCFHMSDCFKHLKFRIEPTLNVEVYLRI